jgi:uncharacterized protein
MDKHFVIDSIASEVRSRLEDEASGHDWWHTYRVWKLARCIGEQEKVDLFVVDLASLLHDIADWKFYDGDYSAGPRAAGEILQRYGVPREIIEHVQQVVKECSFKGAGIKTVPSSSEGRVVQDADRLDAVGAIGIARTFAYGGYTGRMLYDPNIKPTMHATVESYSSGGTHSINHFYEKLLLLKNLMNTEAAKAIARRRHKFMVEYLSHFYNEWEGVA